MKRALLSDEEVEVATDALLAFAVDRRQWARFNNESIISAAQARRAASIAEELAARLRAP